MLIMSLNAAELATLTACACAHAEQPPAAFVMPTSLRLLCRLLRLPKPPADGGPALFVLTLEDDEYALASVLLARTNAEVVA